MNEPKVVYRNKLLLFWLPTCLRVSYSTARHFTFKPCAPPPKKNWGGVATVHWFCSQLGAENLFVQYMQCGLKRKCERCHELENTKSVEKLESDVFDAVGVPVGAEQHENFSGVGHERHGRSRTTTEPATDRQTDRQTPSSKSHSTRTSLASVTRDADGAD